MVAKKKSRRNKYGPLISFISLELFRIESKGVQSKADKKLIETLMKRMKLAEQHHEREEKRLRKPLELLMETEKLKELKISVKRRSRGKAPAKKTVEEILVIPEIDRQLEKLALILNYSKIDLKTHLISDSIWPLLIGFDSNNSGFPVTFIGKLTELNVKTVGRLQAQLNRELRQKDRSTNQKLLEWYLYSIFPNDTDETRLFYRKIGKTIAKFWSSI